MEEIIYIPKAKMDVTFPDTPTTTESAKLAYVACSSPEEAINLGYKNICEYYEKIENVKLTTDDRKKELDVEFSDGLKYHIYDFDYYTKTNNSVKKLNNKLKKANTKFVKIVIDLIIIFLFICLLINALNGILDFA